jgi:GDP-4-dehydro-6-deoxy-D-mannose reductase
MKKNILITGSTGNIGMLLMNRLIKNGNNVVGISLNAIKKKNLENFDLNKIKDDQITFILKKYKIDTIIHLAADIKTDSLDGFILNSFALNKFFCNKLGKNLKYVVMSSASEYGDSDKSILNEDTSMLCPVTNYGISKLLQTTLCYFYNKNNNIDITIIRLFNIIAPFLPVSSIIGSLIDKVKNNKNIKINNYNIKRDFLDLRDFVQLVCLIVNSNKKTMIYNVGSGVSVSYKEFIELFNEVLKENNKKTVNIELVSDFQRKNDYTADVSKVKKDFNWSPKYSLNESIKWCLKENNVI